MKAPRTKALPVSQRSLEEIVVARRQASALISEHERLGPPLEMLEMEELRKEESRELLERQGRKKYPGVSNIMLRSMSAGVVRYGGASVRMDSDQSLPRSPRLLSTAPMQPRGAANELFLQSLVRPKTVADDTSMEGSIGQMADTSTVTPQPSFKSLAPPVEKVEDDPIAEQAQLIQTLTSQCNSLAWRLVAVEQELEEAKKVQEVSASTALRLQQLDPASAVRVRKAAELDMSMRRSRSKSPTKDRRGDSSSPEPREPLHPKVLPIEKASKNIQMLVMNLTKSLYGNDKAKSEAKEMSDALKAAAAAKARLEAYTAAKNEWKRIHSTELIMVLKMEVDRQRILAEKIESFKHMLANRKRQVFLQEWWKVMKDNIDQRKQLIKAAMDMENRHFNSVMGRIITAWKEAAHGPWSRKGSQERHRVRMENARKALSEKLAARGESVGLITQEMLIEEVRRTVIDKLELQREFHSKKQCLHAIKNNVIEARENERISIKHYKCSVMQKVFIPWTEWSYLNSIGLDKARWKAPRQYTVSYNQAAVDAFSDRRVKKLFFELWLPVTKRYVEAKKMRRRNLSNYIRRHMYAWQDVAKHQRAVVINALKEWTSYGVRLMEVPFRMWFVWMDMRKRKKADQQRLVTAYIRTKHRKFLWNIVRGWRHQAVYGRIAGLYSRNDLMKSLTEQKQQCKMMENEMNSYIGSVNEMNKLLEDNTEKVKDMEEQLRKKDDKAKELRLAMHHCEQEMVRMQSLVECVRKVHPVVTEHIEELQGGEFDFEFRGLHALVDLRHKEEKESGKETILSGADLADEDDDGGLLFGKEDEVDGEGAGEDDVIAAEKRSPDQKASAAAVRDEVVVESEESRRLAWALQQSDFRDLSSLGGVTLDEGDAVNEAEQEQWDVALMADELKRMYGLFEFLRNGDVEALEPKLRKSWTGAPESRPASPVKSERGANDESTGEGADARDEEKKDAADGNEEAGRDHEPYKPVNRNWSKITNPATITGEPYQWKDFILSLNRKLPEGRKTETTQDRVMRRLQMGKERKEMMLTASGEASNRVPNLPTTDLDDNLYTGKDFEDNFKPATPRGWSVDAGGK